MTDTPMTQLERANELVALLREKVERVEREAEDYKRVVEARGEQEIYLQDQIVALKMALDLFRRVIEAVRTRPAKEFTAMHTALMGAFRQFEVQSSRRADAPSQGLGEIRQGMTPPVRPVPAEQAHHPDMTCHVECSQRYARERGWID